MKKILLCGLLCCAIMLSVGPALASTESPLQQLTGEVWMTSSEDSKLTLLFGVECAIEMEFATAQFMAKQQGKNADKESIVQHLSPFAKRWITAFDGINRKDIAKEIDAWYEKNQDKLSTRVFKVIWKELLNPRLQKR